MQNVSKSENTWRRTDNKRGQRGWAAMLAIQGATLAAGIVVCATAGAADDSDHYYPMPDPQEVTMLRALLGVEPLPAIDASTPTPAVLRAAAAAETAAVEAEATAHRARQARKDAALATVEARAAAAKAQAATGRARAISQG